MFHFYRYTHERLIHVRKEYKWNIYQLRNTLFFVRTVKYCNVFSISDRQKCLCSWTHSSSRNITSTRKLLTFHIIRKANYFLKETFRCLYYWRGFFKIVQSVSTWENIVIKPLLVMIIQRPISSQYCLNKC